MSTLRGELAGEHGKIQLMRGDFAEARRLLEIARHRTPNWKLRAACLAMRLAPNLLRQIYLTRGPQLEDVATSAR